MWREGDVHDSTDLSEREETEDEGSRRSLGSLE